MKLERLNKDKDNDEKSNTAKNIYSVIFLLIIK